VKLVIKGTPYDVNDAFKVPTINDMLRIVKVTGLSLADISTRFVEMAEAGDNAQVAGSTRLMEGFRAFVWLVRTAAGEKVTLDEANDFTWSDWHFDVEAEEAQAEPDPTQAPGPSGEDGANQAGKSDANATRTSKTSRKRSTRV
jgi:hypothetical protein